MEPDIKAELVLIKPRLSIILFMISLLNTVVKDNYYQTYS